MGGLLGLYRQWASRLVRCFMLRRKRIPIREVYWRDLHDLSRPSCATQQRYGCAARDRRSTKAPKHLWSGVLVNLHNPETALFFLAFLPQFIHPARGHAMLWILQLGVLFALMGWLSDSAWALLAASWKRSPPPRTTQCFRRRADRFRSCFCLLRRKIEIAVV